MRQDLTHEAVCVAARDRIAWLAGRVEHLEVVLRKHHEWHQNQGEVSAPDGKGGYVTWDAADAYADSGLHDETVAALGPSPIGTRQEKDRG